MLMWWLSSASRQTRAGVLSLSKVETRPRPLTGDACAKAHQPPTTSLRLHRQTDAGTKNQCVQRLLKLDSLRIFHFYLVPSPNLPIGGEPRRNHKRCSKFLHRSAWPMRPAFLQLHTPTIRGNLDGLPPPCYNIFRYYEGDALRISVK